MGQSLDAVCTTCKKSYYIGYGGAKSHEYLESQFPIALHEEHDFTFYSSDYTFEKNGNLYNDGCGFTDDELWISGFDKYEFLDFYKIPIVQWMNADTGFYDEDLPLPTD